MAVNVEGNAIVKVDGQQAGQQIESLEQKTKDFRAELRKVRKEKPFEGQEAQIKKLKEQIKHTGQEVRALKKNTFDYNKVLQNLSGSSIRDLTRLQAKLNFETKMLGRNTTAYAQKSTQLKSVTAELTKIKTQMRGINTQSSMFSRMGDGFNKYMGLVAGIGAAFVGVTLGVRKFIQSHNDFEERIDNLSALTKLSGDNLKYLEGQALSMSTTTTEEGIKITQGATDIADAFTLMGSKRPDLLAVKEDLRDVTKDAIILSEAAKTKLEPATKTLATALNQFNAEASESRRFINAIAAGSQAGAADVPYLGEALEKLGTTAKIMNVEFEETIGVIEAVAPYYEKASMAGNSLDKILLKMKAKQIGYKDGVFDLNTAIDELRVRFENGESAADLFGVEHAKMGELLVLNQDKFNYYTDAVTGTNTAIEQAITNTSNNNAELAQARNRTEEQAIALGEKLAPALTVSTNSLNYLLKALTVLVENFDMVKKILIITVSTIATYTLVTKGAAIATRALAIATNVLTAAQKAFKNATKANPWGIILAALVAVTAAIAVFSDELLGVTKLNKLQNDIARETQKRMAKESVQLDVIRKKLEDTNTTQAERKNLIGQINDKYGKYLPNLLNENSSLEDIEKAYAAINEQIKRKIELQVTAEKAQEVYREIIDKKDDLAEFASDIPTTATGMIGNLLFGTGQYAGASKLIDDIKDLEGTYEDLVNMMQKGAIADIANKPGPGKKDNNNYTPSASSSDNVKKQVDDQKKALAEIYDFIVDKERELQDINPFERKLEEIDLYYDELIHKAVDAGAAQEEIDQLNELRDEEIDQLKLENAEKTQQAIFELKKQYGILTQEELLNAELLAFENNELSKTLSADQHEAARTAIRKKHAEIAKKYAEENKTRIQKNQDIELEFIKNVADSYASALEQGNLTAKEAMKIFLINSLDMLKRQVQLMIAASTAKEIGTKGFAGIATAAVLAGVINAAFALAKGAINGFSDGGYTGPGQKQEVAGVVHKDEYVIPSDMLANSNVAKVVSSLESARTGGSLNYSAINSAMSKGFAEGGYTSPSAATPISNSTDVTIIQLELLAEFKAFKEEITEWQKNLKAYVVFGDFEDAQEEMTAIRTDVTLGN